MRTLKLKAAAYHRNGSGGLGFIVALVDDKQNGPMVVIFADADGNESGLTPTFVLNLDLLAQGNIRFAENSWRGDIYECLRLDAERMVEAGRVKP